MAKKKNRDALVFLEDILECIEKIEKYVIVYRKRIALISFCVHPEEQGQVPLNQGEQISCDRYNFEIEPYFQKDLDLDLNILPGKIPNPIRFSTKIFSYCVT